VVARPVSGRVLVKRPGSTAFAALTTTTALPLGSELDTKAGKVQLTAEPGPGKAVQKAMFYGGIFQVTQPGALIDVKLTEKLACAKKGKPSSRLLWGEGKGAFRTTGSSSSATVNGTTWLVQDTCTSTLTRVTVGVVAVRDTVKKKTFLVRAGKSYTARAKR